jgi:hypothetical protein
MERTDKTMCEEIAGLARRHLEAPGRSGLQDIESQIEQATRAAHWDEVSKWHRVRLRYIRLDRERGLGNALRA